MYHFAMNDIIFNPDNPLMLIAGPCVIESEDHCLFMAEELKSLADRLNTPFIFKSSYLKANRSSIESYVGPGLLRGLEILQRVKKELGVPVLSDVHSVEEVRPAAKVLDIIQIPAFLCRQTSLLLEAGKTGCVINVKKGQFLSPYEVKNVIEKIFSTGNHKVIITERGASFGYNNLVVDMRSLEIMKRLGVPVIFDATHSVQLPGSLGPSSGGQRQFVACLAKAAVAVGINALFVEIHDRPEEALCDGSNMITPDELANLIPLLKRIDKIIKGQAL